jgi:hypothetical protein
VYKRIHHTKDNWLTAVLKPKLDKTDALGSTLRNKPGNVSNVKKQKQNLKDNATEYSSDDEVTVFVFIAQNIQTRSEVMDGSPAGNVRNGSMKTVLPRMTRPCTVLSAAILVEFS